MAESTVSPAPRLSIEELIRRAGLMLENALGSVDPGSSWDQVREARHLLSQAEGALETGASRPDPKFGRIWTERKPLKGVPTFLVCGYDRLAAPTVLYYVTLSAAVGRKVDTALQVFNWMDDWPEKRYVD